MISPLKKITLHNFKTEDGQTQFGELGLTYRLIGQDHKDAPVVLVNHALTGNSDVASAEAGWWRGIIGPDLLIDTKQFAVLAFDIPGNGADQTVFDQHDQFTARDIARIFIEGLRVMEIKQLHTVIGGSLGGGIAWEMSILAPELSKYIIPVASHWCASDWMLGHNYIQESLLKHSSNPLEDARMMAMLFYRTPASLTAKFNRTKVEGKDIFNVNSWLQHHGDKLVGRFALNSYRQMNHLLSSVDISRERSADVSEVFKQIKSTIVQVGIDSDLFFVPADNKKTKRQLDAVGVNNAYREITSIHGHDGFLIEDDQLTKLLKPYFTI